MAHNHNEMTGEQKYLAVKLFADKLPAYQEEWHPGDQERWILAAKAIAISVRAICGAPDDPEKPEGR